MTPSVLTVSRADDQGGAARAAYRVFEALQKLDVQNQMLVMRKSSSNPAVRLASGRAFNLIRRLLYRLDNLPLNRYPKRNRAVFWSTNWLPNGLSFQDFSPDLYHFHWIGSGFVPITAMRHITKPIVWTLHDEWAFTGGCHYTSGCERFHAQCGNCPILASGKEDDLSRHTWKRKWQAWQNLNIHPVTPSHWLAERARQSSLFKGRNVRVIPNGIDLEVYHPVDKAAAKNILGLTESKRIILFGASESTSDPRKGFPYLVEALNKLRSPSEAEFLIFGASRMDSVQEIGVPTRLLGHLHDDVTLALMYSAADVFVAPSKEDNLPNTIMESLACGTPAVAFRVGGIPDLIEDHQNGYLANPYDTDELAYGIQWVLEDRERHAQLGLRARQKVEDEFDIRNIARQYQALYTEVLSDKPARI